MKSKIVDFFRLCLVSPEFLVALLCLLLYMRWQDFFIMVGNWLLGLEGDERIYLASGIVGITAFGIIKAKEILFPSNNPTNKILIKWPDFPRLKVRVIFSIITCILSILAYFTLLIFKKELSVSFCGLFLVVIFMVSLASLLSLIFASWSIKEILTGDITSETNH